MEIPYINTLANKFFGKGLRIIGCGKYKEDRLTLFKSFV